LLGRWSHRSRARIHELVQREQDVTEAVRAERRKLAHELHDIVSHSVSVMVLQARGARRVLDDDPPRADEALGNIERVGKQSMVELRRLLGVPRRHPPRTPPRLPPEAHRNPASPTSRSSSKPCSSVD
jgi:signal transduction histidine kinase